MPPDSADTAATTGHVGQAGGVCNPWLGRRRGRLADWLTQKWVRATGRPVLWTDHPWLRAYAAPTDRPSDEWLAAVAEQSGLTIHPDAPDAGLLPRFDALRGPSFEPADVAEPIRRFYERTPEHRLDVWSRWDPAFVPFGWLLAVVFSRRLDQLNLPLNPLDASGGVASTYVDFRHANGDHRATAWVRRLPATGRHAYIGLYSTCRPPGAEGPCVQTVFLLPNGSATVLLEPSSLPEGGLRLRSAGRRFGDPGFYFTLNDGGGRGVARFVRSVTETLDLHADADGTVRTTHTLRYFGQRAFELRYRITRG